MRRGKSIKPICNLTAIHLRWSREEVAQQRILQAATRPLSTETFRQHNQTQENGGIDLFCFRPALGDRFKWELIEQRQKQKCASERGEASFTPRLGIDRWPPRDALQQSLESIRRTTETRSDDLRRLTADTRHQRVKIAIAQCRQDLVSLVRPLIQTSE